MNDNNYVIIGPNRETRNVVVSWSNVRLPFEPKGWLLEMRDELRLAVRNIKAEENMLLFGLFQSADETFCDIENVLFYNVGSGPSHICVERVFALYDCFILHPV